MNEETTNMDTACCLESLRGMSLLHPAVGRSLHIGGVSCLSLLLHIAVYPTLSSTQEPWCKALKVADWLSFSCSSTTP